MVRGLVKGADPRRASPGAEYVYDGENKIIRFPIAVSAGASAHQILQVTIETELGLEGHGKRQAHCGVVGKKLLCVENDSHRFRKSSGVGIDMPTLFEMRRGVLFNHTRNGSRR